MKEEGPDGQGAAGPRYTSVRLGPPKEVYLGGRHEVLSGLDQGGAGEGFDREAHWKRTSQAEPWCSAMAGWSRLAGDSRRS